MQTAWIEMCKKKSTQQGITNECFALISVSQLESAINKNPNKQITACVCLENDKKWYHISNPCNPFDFRRVYDRILYDME